MTMAELEQSLRVVAVVAQNAPDSVSELGFGFDGENIVTYTTINRDAQIAYEMMKEATPKIIDRLILAERLIRTLEESLRNEITYLDVCECVYCKTIRLIQEHYNATTQ